jgi:porphobilinogen deaminase
MSEGTENKEKRSQLSTQPPTGKVVIELNRDKEMERLQEENKDLTTKLAVIAEREFYEKSEQISNALGVNKSDITPETYPAFKELYNKKTSESKLYPQVSRGGEGCSWTQNQQGIYPLENPDNLPLSMLTFSNEQEALIEIQKRAREKDPEATEYMQRLTKRLTKEGFEFEFQGDSKQFLKHDLPISENMPIEEQQRRKRYNDKLLANRTNWTNID